MALIRRRVTPRIIAANRANALRSTGPRTARGKAQSRLNGLKNGLSSRLFLNYFQLWLNGLMHGPWEPPLAWKFSEMPTPFYCHPGNDRQQARRVREFLLSIERFPQPAPRTRAARRKKGKLNNLFLLPGAVNPLKTQEGLPKTNPF
jgi:hypothetical protein